jgi:hypothetical protein
MCGVPIVGVHGVDWPLSVPRMVPRLQERKLRLSGLPEILHMAGRFSIHLHLVCTNDTADSETLLCIFVSRMYTQCSWMQHAEIF